MSYPVNTLPHSSGADLLLAVPSCAFAGGIALATGYAIYPGLKIDEFYALTLWASVVAFVESIVVVIPSYFILRSISQLGKLQYTAVGLMEGLVSAEIASRAGMTGRVQFVLAGLISGLVAFLVLAQLARRRAEDAALSNLN